MFAIVGIVDAGAPVQAVISDYRMPGMNGVEFLRHLMYSSDYEACLFSPRASHAVWRMTLPLTMNTTISAMLVA